jgi:hypothetical protein
MKAFVTAVLFTIVAVASMVTYFNGPGARDAKTEYSSPSSVRL